MNLNTDWWGAAAAAATLCSVSTEGSRGGVYGIASFGLVTECHTWRASCSREGA